MYLVCVPYTMALDIFKRFISQPAIFVFSMLQSLATITSCISCFTPVYQVLQITNFISSVTKLDVYQVLQSGVSSVTITSCIAGVHLLAVSVLRVFNSLAVYQVLVSVSGVTITSFLSVGTVIGCKSSVTLLCNRCYS